MSLGISESKVSLLSRERNDKNMMGPAMRQLIKKWSERVCCRNGKVRVLEECKTRSVAVDVGSRSKEMSRAG